jgi:hypothetical protein
MGKKKASADPPRGRGRPIGKDGPTVLLAVTVPETLVAELDRLAESKGWKRSKVATEAIRAYLKRK